MDEPFSLIIDKEFHNLSPSLSEEKYTLLEKNVFDAGCLEPIHTWKRIILDGHKRYEICTRWNIPYHISSHNFDSREEAIVWICQRHLQNKEINDELHRFLIGKHYETEKIIFLNHYMEAGIPRYHYKIATSLGKTYSLAPNTIYKYGIYSRCIEMISEKNESIAKKILSGKLKISHDNVMELSRLSKTNINRLNDCLSETDIEHISYSEIRHELQWKSITASAHVKQKRQSQNNMAIKQIPQYDPDAEISSLTLTIPSWISSIKRTQETANLPLVSNQAKEKIKQTLISLSNTIDDMLSAIKEEI